MRRFLFLFFSFPFLLFAQRYIFAGLDIGVNILYVGVIIWGILLAIYFARLPQKPNNPPSSS